MCAEIEFTLVRRFCRQSSDPAKGRRWCVGAGPLDDWQGHVKVGALGQQDVGMNRPKASGRGAAACVLSAGRL